MANNSFMTKKGLFTISHTFDHQSKLQSIYIYNRDITVLMKHNTHKKNKKQNPLRYSVFVFVNSSETKEIRSGRWLYSLSTNPPKFQHALYIIISRFTATRPDTCSHVANHAFTYPWSSNKISGRRRDGLTEKRVHPRRRRRRGSGGILDERRRPLAFPLLGQCPRASRVVSSTTTRSVCAPLLACATAEFLERATPPHATCLPTKLEKRRGSAGLCVFPPRPTHDVHEEGPHNACAGNLRDRLPCHYCSTELWWWLWWW